MPSPRKKEACLPAAGAGTNPDVPATDDVAPPMLLYVAFGGVCHVPSPRRYLPCAPAAGAGTKPAFPAAEEVAAPHIGICGVGVRPRNVHVHLAATVKNNGIVLAIGRVSDLNKTQIIARGLGVSRVIVSPRDIHIHLTISIQGYGIVLPTRGITDLNQS